ncbi:MAG: cell envelope integrity protein CreD [Spirochaetia bacterium]|nr:cell envelope integrity protein CreD [Spirochaetia bacterium]
MINDENIIEKTSNYFKKSVTLKILTVGFLILVMLIPAAMIQNLIQERQSRRNSVVSEISQKWGNKQTVTGPFITIPFKTTFKDDKGKTQYNINYLHILPETLNVTGNMKPEVRYRSLFEAVLYSAKLQINGNFKLPQLNQLSADQKYILWDEAYLSLGISDMRGIQDKIIINFNGANYSANPGLKTSDLAEAGVSTLTMPLKANGTYKFSLDLSINGSEQINFIPLGESTAVKLGSTWPSPSFNGAYLPTSRDVGKNGFSANWKILHLNRNYPQSWESAKYDIDPSAFGLQLIMTADIYQKSTRLAKYAIMFLVFTFAAFFFSEIINKQKIHPIQYILIGMAILLFYTLVLSLSEHIRFNFAYVLSALAVTLIISGYARAVISNSRFSLMILVILSILYSYLFIILQLEDYALIMGSIGLLIILSVVMYLTRKINWYEIDTQ